jgi:two-component system sensor histidine kinase HydH
MRFGPRRSSAVLLLGAGLLGLALVGAGLATWDAVRAASTTITRGQADLIYDELRVAIGRGLPSADELREILQSDTEDELSYVAIVDTAGDVLVEAGRSVSPTVGARDPGAPSQMLTLTRVGDRVRATYRRGLRRRIASALGAPPSTQLIFEFVPRQANALEAQARRGVVLAAAAAAGALILAVLYARQRRLADEALHKEEQSRRLAGLGQMSAVLAHELRNPLASLKGHAQLLERALPAGDSPRLKAERVVVEAVRLERLIDDLLAFVRSGQLARAPTELGALMRDVVEERGAGRATLHADAEITLAVDRERLRQVLVNLVDNATQSGEGPIEVSLRRDGSQVALAVRDHGPGIAAADLPHLFEPFYTTRTQGTGLGLAIARQIVELHGGTLAAETPSDGGARFVVRLPGRET